MCKVYRGSYERYPIRYSIGYSIEYSVGYSMRYSIGYSIKNIQVVF